MGVVDESDAAFLEIATGLAGDVIESGTETGDQRDRGRVCAFALGGVFALLAEVEVIAGIFGFVHRRPGFLADA